MSQENKEKMGTKNSQMLKITLVSLLAVSLFLIELYEIINDPANMIVIGALGVFLLASVCAEMLLIRKQMEENAKGQDEAFDNVYRSEKASYLLIKKYFDKMEKKMENLSEPSDLPYKELIAAQKALAKAQINRGKQNTNALLISNDRLMKRINSIQSDLENLNIHTSESNSGLSERDQEVFAEGNKQVLDKQQEILDGLKVLETSLRNEILESADKMASMKSQQISVPQSQTQDQEDIQPLEIDADFSFGGSLGVPQTEENSSESDLDKLLMQMDSEDNFEPKLQPIAEEPELAPIMEEPVLPPIMEEPELSPTIQEPELPPIMEESDFSTMMDEAPLPSIMESELPSVMDEPELAPMIEEPELPPIVDEPDLSPIVEESDLSSIVDEPDFSFKDGESGLSPVMEEPVLQPMIEEPELPSMLSEPILEPIVEEPELSPVMGEHALEPIIEEPELPPIVEESELPPMVSEPILEPIAEETQEAPVMEAELPPIPETTARPASTEAELQAMIDRLKPKQEVAKTVAEHAVSRAAESVKKQEQPAPVENENDSHEITPDRLAAMIANLGNEPILEEPEALKSEAAPVEVSTLQPDVQNFMEPISQPVDSKPAAVQQESPDTIVDDDELEQIMKAMDIDMDLGQSVEDMDIDKILEVPLSNDNGNTSSNPVMSSDEIAALIANTDLLSEPESVKNSDYPDLSDPSHVMSSDEIAALIANM